LSPFLFEMESRTENGGPEKYAERYMLARDSYYFQGALLREFPG
jgi:hypothetical protein